MTLKFTTKEDVQAVVDGATKRIDLLLTGVVVVMFIGFLTLLATVISPIIDATRQKAASYENLQDEVQTQNAKIDDQNKKLETLTLKISDLNWVINQQTKILQGSK